MDGVDARSPRIELYDLISSLPLLLRSCPLACQVTVVRAQSRAQSSAPRLEPHERSQSPSHRGMLQVYTSISSLREKAAMAHTV